MTTLSDPIGALVHYLSDHELITDTGKCRYVTAPLLTKRGVAITVEAPPAIALKGAGLGSGAGHDAQASYGSIRVDCLCYGRTDFDAWRLGLLAERAILSARGKGMAYWHEDIEYKTRFVTIVMSGGPIPLRDEQTDWPAVLRVFHIEATQAT